MSEEMDRRGYLKYAATAGVSAVIGLAAGYGLSQYAGPAPTPMPTPTPTPTPAKSINILAFSHWETEARMIASNYATNTGIKTEFETITSQDARDKLVAAFKTGSSSWDIAPTWPEWSKEYTYNEWTADLTDLCDKLFGPEREDLVSGIFDNFIYEDKIYAMPFDIGCPLLQWNKELLKEAGLDPEKPYEWHSIPNSINEFVEYAKATTFTKDGVQYWGYAEQLLDQAYGVHTIYTQMFGGKMLDLSKNPPWGEPIMNKKPGVDALQFLVDLLHKHKCMDPASTTYNWCFDYMPGYLDGRTCFLDTYPFVIHVSQDPEKSKIVDKTGFAPAFAAVTSASYDGTEANFVPTMAPHGIQEAFKYVEHLASFHMLRKVALMGTWTPFYKSLLTDPEVTEKIYEAPAVLKSYEYPHDNFTTPDYAEWIFILRAEIHSALRLEKKPQEAMDDCVKGINRLREEKGRLP